MDLEHSVSVVIPCYNEAKYIEKCILSIIDGTSPDILLEILLVDADSTDNTIKIVNELAAKHQVVKLLKNEKRYTQFGLNLGIKNASHEWVLIAGAHALYSPEYIETLIDKSLALDADGVGGQLVTNVLSKTSTSIAIKTVLSHPIGVGNSMFRLGVKTPTKVDTVPFGLYRKSLFEKVGYYNDSLIRNHDIEWSKRVVSAGYSIYLIPDVTCTYYARETFLSLAKNNFRNGLWNIYAVYLTKNFSSLSVRHFIPLCFVLGIIFGIVGSFFSFALFVLLASLLSVYVLILLFFSFKDRTDKTTFIHILWAFMVLHFTYGFGSLIGLLTLNRSKK